MLGPNHIRKNSFPQHSCGKLLHFKFPDITRSYWGSLPSPCIPGPASALTILG